MANKPVYWADLPAFLPGHYRQRTMLSQAFTLQFSGSVRGARQRVTLYRITPEGRLVRTWSMGFQVRKGSAPSSARYKALNLFLEAAEKDPRLTRRLTIGDAIEGAKAALEAQAGNR